MSKVKADTLANRLDTKSVPTDTVIAGSAKAWVNFNGAGTVAIRDSFNVSSITDNGVGNYTVNFTNAMPSGDYLALGMVSSTGSDSSLTVSSSVPPTVSALNVYSASIGALADATYAMCAVFSN